MSETHEHPTPPELTGRRGFLAWVTYALTSVVAVVLGIPAIAFLIDPRNRKANASDFKDIARLSELVVGQPKEFVIRETTRDAWTIYPDQIVGRVFLIRDQNDSVKAFTSVCPHLGCSVNFTGSTTGVSFLCPCHGGKFSLDGDKVGENPSPRPMDTLEVRPNPDNPAIIQVKYQKFKQLEAEKVVVG